MWWMSADVDECEIYGTSCHSCLNTVGSFTCTCRDGYKLVDGKICQGTANISQYLVSSIAVAVISTYMQARFYRNYIRVNGNEAPYDERQRRCGYGQGCFPRRLRYLGERSRADLKATQCSVLDMSVLYVRQTAFHVTYKGQGRDFGAISPAPTQICACIYG